MRRSSLWNAIVAAAPAAWTPGDLATVRADHDVMTANLRRDGKGMLARAIAGNEPEGMEVRLPGMDREALSAHGATVPMGNDLFLLLAFADVAVNAYATDPKGELQLSPVAWMEGRKGIPTIGDLAHLSGDEWVEDHESRWGEGRPGPPDAEHQEALDALVDAVGIEHPGAVEIMAAMPWDAPGEVDVRLAHWTQAPPTPLVEAVRARLPRRAYEACGTNERRLASSWGKRRHHTFVEAAAQPSASLRAAVGKGRADRLEAWFRRTGEPVEVRVG